MLCSAKCALKGVLFSVLICLAYLSSQWSYADSIDIPVSQDGYFWEINPGGRGHEQDLQVGYSPNSFPPQGETNSALKFNVSSSIPGNAVISSAELWCYHFDAYGSWNYIWIGAYNAGNDWNEDNISWLQPWIDGGDVGGQNVEENNKWYIWEIKSLVQNWQNGTKPNYGVILHSGNSTDNRKRFYAREANNGKTPFLRVEYTIPKPDLTPYKPSTWGNKIVVSMSQNKFTDDTIYADEQAYIHFAVKNVGTANAGFHRVLLEVTEDGYSKKYDVSSLAVNQEKEWSNIPYTFSKPQSYTIKVTCDCDGHIGESNESNNVFSRVIGVKQPNLTLYKPNGWSDKIVVSANSGTYTEQDVYAGIPAYIHWGELNNGDGGASSHMNRVYIVEDFNIIECGITGLGSGIGHQWTNLEYTFAESKDYTIWVTCDVDNDIKESDESIEDNEEEHTIFVRRPPPEPYISYHNINKSECYYSFELLPQLFV